MSRTVHCVLLKTDADGLDFAPWPGELGQRIYGLNPLEYKDRAYLADQMERFLFLGEVTQPPGYLLAHTVPDPNP